MTFQERFVRSRRFRVVGVGLPLGFLITLVNRFGTDLQLHLTVGSLFAGACMLLVYGLRKTDETNIVITKQREELQKEKERSEQLRLNILPFEIAEKLKRTGECQAKTYSMVTVMFADSKSTWEGFIDALRLC